VIVVGSIAVEKLAVGATKVETPVALFLGVVPVTVGVTVELWVVNFQVTADASGAPSEALTLEASVAVNVVP